MSSTVSARVTAAVDEVVARRGRYAQAWLPGPEPFPRVEASCLSADRRGRVHLHVALDRVTSLSEAAVAAADALAGIGVLRVIAATNTRRPFVRGAGTYTTVHALRADERDALTALAALDEDDIAPAIALAERWAAEVPEFAQRSSARVCGWLAARLEAELASLAAMTASGHDDRQGDR